MLGTIVPRTGLICDTNNTRTINENFAIKRGNVLARENSRGATENRDADRVFAELTIQFGASSGLLNSLTIRPRFVVAVRVAGGTIG